MSNERKQLFRNVADAMGLSRHDVMPEWQKGNRNILANLRRVIPIQRGIFSKAGEQIDVSQIPEDQRKVGI